MHFWNTFIQKRVNPSSPLAALPPVINMSSRKISKQVTQISENSSEIEKRGNKCEREGERRGRERGEGERGEAQVTTHDSVY